MTTRMTDEEIRAMAIQLETVTPTVMQPVIDMLRAWLAERQAARDVVTDEMASKVLLSLPNFARYNHNESEWANDVSAMRAALQSIAQPVRVPDAKPLPDLMLASYHEAVGWNACREAMLSTSLHPQQAVPDGWWVAIEDPQDVNEIAMSWNAADWNNGEVARTEANQWINDQPNPGNFSLKFVSAAPAYNGKKETT